ncbi:MAG: lysophospholipid acyltransferase family protein [Pseudomonadota bacterium]
MDWPKPLRYLWSGWAILWLLITTIPIASMVVVMGWLRLGDDRAQYLARFWARILIGGAGCPIRLEGGEKLEPGGAYVFACNHSSALDIPALLSLLPRNFRWIAKKELFSIPIFGPALTAAGYIPIDRGDHRKAMASITRAAERIMNGVSVVIFPEGTRSPDGKLLPFKSGGFMLALKSQRPVVPVAIVGSSRALPAKRLLLNPGRIRVILGDPLPTTGLKTGDREALAELTRRKVQELLDHAG